MENIDLANELDCLVTDMEQTGSLFEIFQDFVENERPAGSDTKRIDQMGAVCFVIRMRTYFSSVEIALQRYHEHLDKLNGLMELAYQNKKAPCATVESISTKEPVNNSFIIQQTVKNVKGENA